MDRIPVELLNFLESRERLTACRFLDKERQSLGSASGSGVDLRARVTSTGSLIEDVTAQDFAILKVLGQVTIVFCFLISFCVVICCGHIRRDHLGEFI